MILVCWVGRARQREVAGRISHEPIELGGEFRWPGHGDTALDGHAGMDLKDSGDGTGGDHERGLEAHRASRPAEAGNLCDNRFTVSDARQVVGLEPYQRQPPTALGEQGRQSQVGLGEGRLDSPMGDVEQSAMEHDAGGVDILEGDDGGVPGRFHATRARRTRAS